MKNKIICIGNRLIPADSAGPAVYDLLRQRPLPSHCELIEGGVSGLNLLCHLENVGVVVFVDAVSGFALPGKMTVLTRARIVAECDSPHYGHDAGVAYLLALLPRVCDGPLPREIYLVGLEGDCPARTLEQAADAAMKLTAGRC